MARVFPFMFLNQKKSAMKAILMSNQVTVCQHGCITTEVVCMSEHFGQSTTTSNHRFISFQIILQLFINVTCKAQQLKYLKFITVQHQKLQKIYLKLKIIDMISKRWASPAWKCKYCSVLLCTTLYGTEAIAYLGTQIWNSVFKNLK